MRHLPKFSDDYGFENAFDQERGHASSLHSRDLDEVVESLGDDWSLEEDEIVDIELLN
jgi:hypothetical protein